MIPREDWRLLVGTESGWRRMAFCLGWRKYKGRGLYYIHRDDEMMIISDFGCHKSLKTVTCM